MGGVMPGPLERGAAIRRLDMLLNGGPDVQRKIIGYLIASERGAPSATQGPDDDWSPSTYELAVMASTAVGDPPENYDLSVIQHVRDHWYREDSGPGQFDIDPAAYPPHEMKAIVSEAYKSALALSLSTGYPIETEVCCAGTCFQAVVREPDQATGRMQVQVQLFTGAWMPGTVRERPLGWEKNLVFSTQTDYQGALAKHEGGKQAPARPLPTEADQLRFSSIQQTVDQLYQAEVEPTLDTDIEALQARFDARNPDLARTIDSLLVNDEQALIAIFRPTTS